MTMTYYSSTTSSTASNVPIRIFSGIGQQSTQQETGTLGWLHGNAVWFYSSTNLPADCAGVAAFTDANKLGIRAGDLLLGVTGTGGSTGGGASGDASCWLGVFVASAASTNPGGILSTAGGQISSNWASST